MTGQDILEDVRVEQGENVSELVDEFLVLGANGCGCIRVGEEQ